jgi:2'-5' RNA ligase
LKKRFFFGFEIDCPWASSEEPKRGLPLPSKERHVTLAFLAEQEEEEVACLVKDIPFGDFCLAPAGIFTKSLLLPHCIAWEIEWKTGKEEVLSFEKSLYAWLMQHLKELPKRRDDSTFHTTVCRKPFCAKEWQDAFTKLPVICTFFHLFESLGHSRYLSRWHHDLTLPFVEIEHTADIAFFIRGKTLQDIYSNAQIALAFHFPKFIPFFEDCKGFSSLDGVIEALNRMVSTIDTHIGSPIKAISYHGSLCQIQSSIYEWEMIVDV